MSKSGVNRAKLSKSLARKNSLSTYSKAVKKVGGSKTKQGKQIIKSYGGPRKLKKKK